MQYPMEPVAPPATSPDVDGPKVRASGFWRAEVLAAAAFLIVCLVTLLLWQQSRHMSRQSADRLFEYRSQRIVAVLEHELQTKEVLLQSLAGLFSLGESRNRNEWRHVFDALERETASSPGRLWVAFAPRVSEAQRKLHEQQSRDDGMAAYTVRASEPRRQYFPLAYLRSFESHDRRSVGVDLQDDAVAREALALAG